MEAKQQKRWLDAALAPLFHFEVLERFSARDERAVIAEAAASASNADLIGDALVAFNCAVREHAVSDPVMDKCILSPRQLQRAARNAAASGDVDAAISAAYF